MTRILIAIAGMVLLLSTAAPALGQGSYFLQRGYANLGIPEGHLPPPGACRIWHPGKPPGHQPPPFKCDRAARGQVLLGVWLLLRPKEDRRYVHVYVYDGRRPGVVIVIGIFQAFTGVFITEVLPK